jgi:hypothetical protein
VTATATVEAPALSAFRRLAVKRGLLPGVLCSQRHADFVVVMAAAAQSLIPGREYTEAGVNEQLKSFLTGAGAMLATDHVELRRWLVDCRLLERDGFGRRYARAETPEAFVKADTGLRDLDLAGIAREACAAETQARRERKARWTALRGGAPS